MPSDEHILYPTSEGELPTEDLRQVAYEELREDADTRRQALAQMREFIDKSPAIIKCRTDAPFLLRFLRTKKYSVPQACAMLERYLTIRQQYPHWFRNLDPLDPELGELIDSGYLIPLPIRDSKGRLIMMTRVCKLDPHKFTSTHMARLHSMFTEYFLDDEANQVLGYVYVTDELDVTMAHVTLWSFSEMRSILNCIQNSTPMRHKEHHFVNIPSFGVKFVEMAITLLSEKIRKRNFVHRSIDDLNDIIGVDLLPKEYGGKIPASEIISDFKKKLIAKRSELLALDDMQIQIEHRTCALEANDLNDELGAGMVGSFRKLEVD